MKTLELTNDACNLIADALKSQIEMLEGRNKMIRIWLLDDATQKYIDENNIKIGELKTLFDYIKTDL